MESGGVLKITPDMSEDEIIQACAEAVLDNAPDDVRKQLDAAAIERGYGSALSLIKGDMKEERGQHETIEGWLAALPGRL
ncbi:MAG: hypothetical protein ACR2RF_10925 [Geminicoccaceae bacterium]